MHKGGNEWSNQAEGGLPDPHGPDTRTLPVRYFANFGTTVASANCWVHCTFPVRQFLCKQERPPTASLRALCPHVDLFCIA